MLSLKHLLRRGIIRSFLFSYLLILAIVTLLGSFTFFASSRELKKAVLERNSGILKTAVRFIDAGIADAMILNTKISASPEVYEFIKIEDSGLTEDNVLQLLLIHNSFVYSYFKEGTVKNIWLISPELDILMTPQVVFDDLPTKFSENEQLLLFDDYRYDDFKTFIMENTFEAELFPSVRIRDPSGTYTAVPLISSVVRAGSTRRDALIILLDPIFLSSYLSELNLPPKGWFLAENSRNGEVLFSINSRWADAAKAKGFRGSPGHFERKIGATHYIGATVVSPVHNIAYSVGVPLKDMIRPVIDNRNLTLAILVVIFVVGLALSTYLSGRYGTPISQAISTLGSSTRDEIIGRPLEYLLSNVRSLTSKTNILEDHLERQREIYGESFVHLVYSGGIPSDREIGDFNRFLGGEDPSLCGVVLHINDFEGVLHEDETVYLAAIHMDLRRIFSGHRLVFISRVDAVRWVALSEQSEEEILRDALNIQEEAQRKLRISLHIGIGKRVKDSRRLGISFVEAKEALDYIIIHAGDSVMSFSDLPEQLDSYYFPIETEQRLITSWGVGDLLTVEGILDTLFEENCNSRNLGPEMTESFLWEIYNALQKALSRFRVDASVEMPPDTISRLDRFRRLKNFWLELSREIGTKQKNARAIVEKVMKFVDDNFADPLLSLTMVADSFGISEGHLSRSFKAQTGENFFRYVSGRRMEKAADLLIGSDLSIDTISRRVGHSSVRVFRRSFKKQFGYTPSHYRLTKREI